MSIAYPEFHASRCTRYRFRYSACGRCADACPHDSITLSEEGVAIDPARCQNCALCVTACHTDALSSSAFKPLDILRAAIRQDHFTIACAPSGAVADAIVPCLGAVDPASLAYLAKRRIPLMMCGASHCAQCAHGAHGAMQLALNLEAYEVLAKAGGTSDPNADWVGPQVEAASVAPHPSGGGARFTASRRQWLRRFVVRGIDELTQVVEPGAASVSTLDKAIRAGAYALPERRELLQIVCARKDAQPFLVPLHDAIPLMALSLRPGCTTCEACFRVCPTGAIKIEESPAEWQLKFDADRCVACAVCLEVCQARVLDADAVLNARPEQGPHMLLAMSKQRCARCDRHFVSHNPQQTCPICRDDEDAFSALFG